VLATLLKKLVPLVLAEVLEFISPLRAYAEEENELDVAVHKLNAITKSHEERLSKLEAVKSA